MSARISSDERLARARAWFDRIQDPQLAWDDVEVVVRLRVVGRESAERILLTDHAVVGRWDDLMAALDAPPDGSPDRPGADLSVDTGPRGVVAARYDALRSWRDDQTGPASEIPDGELLQLAESPPASERAFKRRQGSARDFSGALHALLQRIGSTDVQDRPATVVPSATAAPTGASSRATAPDQRDAASSAPVVPAADAVTEQATVPAETDGNVRPTGETDLVDFSHYTYPEAGTVPPTPGAVSFDATGGESVELSWPDVPDDGRIHLFSVVTKSEYLPSASPTLGDVVISTFESSATDTSLFRSAVRHVAVWLSSGGTEQEARLAQPRLWAVGETVLPVRSCTVREDEGTVIGNWEPIPGAEHFDVYRVPLGSGLDARREVDVNHKLPASIVTSGGFTDREAVPGTAYEYRVYAVALLGGANRSSPPVSRLVTLEAVAEQVLDLQVTPSEGSETSFDLTWTQPALGQVEIFRTAEAPASGLDERVLDRSALEGQAGLRAEHRVERAREYDGERVFLREVPWPTGWSRAYFTPATVVNETLIRVGPSQSLTRAGAPSQVRLVERVDSQFLTFAWPLGSPTVRIYQGPKGSTHVDPQSEHAVFDISEDDYRKYGGAHLAHPLPPEGCSVHVVGVSYSGGRARYSTPVTVQYDGLARLWYRFESTRPEGRGRRQSVPATRRVLVRSELPFNVDLALVHHERRLPLHLRDGVELQRRPISVGPQEQVCFDPVDTTGRAGFVRVFADVPAAQGHLLAVLDPALDELRLGHQ